MKISILTLFPEMFKGPFDHSILKHAQEKKLAAINIVNIRDFGIGKHKIVDDKPYGGGTGMIMRVDVLDRAIANVKCQSFDDAQDDHERSRMGQMSNVKCQERIILMDPKGKTFNQQKAQELSSFDHLILICGHYEGVDSRIKTITDEEISIGNFIATGGEIPAMLITDTVVRLIKEVLKEGVTRSESFSKELPQTSNKYNYLEYPQYTRPRSYKNMSVPKVLLSGNHKQIQEWKKKNISVKAVQK